MSFRWKTLFFTLLIFNSSPLSGSVQPLTIVIVGGGPAGLGTAIEAKLAGANVTVVEKRDQYTREQYFFLWGPSLKILEKWQVPIPDFYLGYDDVDHELVGIVKIKNFEEGLEKRVKELGIPKIEGEFKTIRNKKAVILQSGQEVEIAYDLLVGADGEHSIVRKELGIKTRCYGNAFGLIAILEKTNPGLHFVLPIWSNSLFINNVSTPSLTIISGQSSQLTKAQLADEAMRNGWVEESDMIRRDDGIFFENIPVSLMQALTFSNQEKSVILLGDAVATASFLQGLGANSALEAAKVAGHFFTTELTENDYAAYNQELQRITDLLVSDSIYLFK